MLYDDHGRESVEDEEASGGKNKMCAISQGLKLP